MKKWLIWLIFAVCHSTNASFYIPWAIQDPLALNVWALTHPVFLLPSSHTPISTGTDCIRHQLSRLIWLFFFLLSLSNLFLPVLFLQSLISCPLSSNSSLHRLNIYSFQLFFFICLWCFHFSPNEILLWSFTLFTPASSDTLTCWHWRL